MSYIVEYTSFSGKTIPVLHKTFTSKDQADAYAAVAIKNGNYRSYNIVESTESTNEGYKILPNIDRDRYGERDGLEGPFRTLSGKVVYYDPKEGSYYDPDSDVYLSYDEFKAYDNDYSNMRDERDIPVKLGESVNSSNVSFDQVNNQTELEEASTKVMIPKSRYLTILKAHGPKKLARTPKGEMQYRGAEHFAHNKDTDTHITQTYSHPDHNIATIERHKHHPTGETRYYMHRKTQKEDVVLDESIVGLKRNVTAMVNRGASKAEIKKRYPQLSDSDIDGFLKQKTKVNEAANYDNMTTAELKAAANAAVKRGDRNAVKAITAAANKRIANKGGTPVTKLTTDPKKLDALKKQLHGIKKEATEVNENKIVATGLLRDKPFRKTFKNVEAMRSWADREDADVRGYHAAPGKGEDTQESEMSDYDSYYEETDLNESFLITSLWIIVAIVFIFAGAAKLRFGDIFRFIKDEYNLRKAFNHFDNMIQKVNEDPELKKTLMDIVRESRSGKKNPRWKRGEYAKVRARFNEIFSGEEKNLINRILGDIRDEVDKDVHKHDRITSIAVSPKKNKSLDEANTSYEKDMDHDKPVVIRGVKGVKSTPFRKKFKNMAAYDRWSDTEAASDYEVQHVVNEDISQDATMMEQDHEVQMARSDLYKLANYSIKLYNLLKTVSEAEGIDGWKQAKITKAADYISSVYHAMEYDMVSQTQSEPMTTVESSDYAKRRKAADDEYYGKKKPKPAAKTVAKTDYQKRRETNETTTAGAVASIAQPTGKPIKRKKK